jgi:hypothetical protein
MWVSAASALTIVAWPVLRPLTLLHWNPLLRLTHDDEEEEEGEEEDDDEWSL